MNQMTKPYAYIVHGKKQTNQKEPTVSKERIDQIKTTLGKYIRKETTQMSSNCYDHTITEGRMTKTEAGNILWLYYNPFCYSKGQFVCHYLSPDVIISVADKYKKTPYFFLELETACRCRVDSCKTEFVDFGNKDFEKMLVTYANAELLLTEQSLINLAKTERK